MGVSGAHFKGISKGASSFGKGGGINASIGLVLLRSVFFLMLFISKACNPSAMT